MKKIAVRLLPLMMAVLLLCSQAFAADETAAQPESAPAPDRLVVVMNNVVDKTRTEDVRQAYLHAAETLALPLMAQAMEEGRSVGMLYVDGQSVTPMVGDKDVATVESVAGAMHDVLARRKGNADQQYSNARHALGSVSASKVLDDAGELWYIQGFLAFEDVLKNGSFDKGGKNLPAYLDAVVELLKDHPGLTVNFVWYGRNPVMPEANACLDQETVRAYVQLKGEDPARVNVYILDPAADPALDADTTTALGLVRHALGLAMPAPAVIAQEAEGAWSGEYIQMNDMAGWLHVTPAEAGAAGLINMTAAVDGSETMPLVIGSERGAWVSLRGVARGQKVTVTADRAVTLQGYTGAEPVIVYAVDGVEAAQPLQNLGWLQNDNTLYLVVTSGNVTLDDVTFTVSRMMANGQPPVPVEATIQDVTPAGEQSKRILRVDCKGMAVGRGTLMVTPVVVNDRLELQLNTVQLPLTVVSRPPAVLETAQAELVNGAAVTSTYRNLPGYANMELRIPLDEYFADPEGETLTYTLSPASANSMWRIDQAAGTLAFLEAGSEANGDATVTITARDPYGESVSLDFTVTRKDAQKELEALRFQYSGDPTQIAGILGEAMEPIVLALDDPDGHFADVATQYGFVTDMLSRFTVEVESMTIDGVPVTELPEVTLDQARNALIVTMPVQLNTAEVVVKLKAFFGDHELTFLAPTLKLFYENQPPKLADETTETAVDLGSAWLEDLLGLKEPLTLDGLCEQTVVPAELITDEPETITDLVYVVTLEGKGAKLYVDGEEAVPMTPVAAQPVETAVPDPAATPTDTEAAPTVEESTVRVYELTYQQGSAPLDIRISKDGAVKVTLTARDSGGLEADATLTWQVRANSRFVQVLIIAGIALAAILALTITITVILIKTRPNFRGLYADVQTADGLQMTLKLDYWNIHSMTLAQLAIAAQLPPSRHLPVGMLAKITMSPLRGRKFSLKASGEAEAINAYLNTQQANLRKGFNFVLGQQIKLYAGQQQNPALSIVLRKRSN